MLGAAAGAIVLFVGIGISSGAFGNYAKNFNNNFSRLFSNFKSEKEQEFKTPAPEIDYITDVTGSKIVSLNDMNRSSFALYKNGILCANMNRLTFIDRTGSVAWEINTAVVDPILKTNGGYILLAEKGRNKICMYNDRKLIYDINEEDPIISVSLSSTGDAVIITDKPSYKGGISVYNKTGARIFSWASGSNSVICADISTASRRVAVSLLNTDAPVSSAVQIFNIDKTEADARLEFGDTVIFNIRFIGDLLCGFGDNRIVGISANGKVVYDNIFENGQLSNCAIDSKGNKLLALDNSNVPMLNMYKKRGAAGGSIDLTGVSEYIDIKDNTAAYNLGRDVYFGKIKSKSLFKYTAAMDVKGLIVVSANMFVIVYSNSIEFVTV